MSRSHGVVGLFYEMSTWGFCRRTQVTSRVVTREVLLKSRCRHTVEHDWPMSREFLLEEQVEGHSEHQDCIGSHGGMTTIGGSQGTSLM
jgi:hypothetical protein